MWLVDPHDSKCYTFEMMSDQPLTRSCIGQDGIVRVGFPAGGEQCTNQISRRFSITTCTPSTRRLLDGVAVRFSDRATVPPDTLIDLRTGGEVLVPGAPFQPENGYLGMWNWEKQGKPVPKDQTPEAQKALRAAFDAERKKFDVEAQQQGFSSAEVRGRRLYFCEASPASPLSYTGARHRRQRAHPRGEGGREGREGGREGGEAAEGEKAAAAAKSAMPAKPVYYGNMKGIAQPATYGVGAPKK